MKTLKYLLAICAFQAFIFQASAQLTNYSSHWVINENQSDFGKLPPATMFKELIVTQTADSLKIEGIRFAGPPSTTTTYPLNGNVVVTFLAGNRKMTANINRQKDKLVRISAYYLADHPDQKDYESKEVWSLSGKQLSIERTFVRSTGNNIIRAVYDRQ